MKKLSVKLIVVVAMAATCISAGIFYGCKKDNPLENGSGKLLKSMYGDNLQEIEYYTPEESTVNEKLMQFANYMNKSQDYPMPNMELKEAVWFAETFFNIGVCEKQRYIAEYTNDRKTYTLSVPFEEMEGNVFLKGNVLQEKYKNLLESIVKEICPEFSLNFGDVFVQSVNYASKTIDLGLTVLYGTKGHKAYDEIGRPIIVGPSGFMYYFGSFPSPTPFNPSNFRNRHDPPVPDSWIFNYCVANSCLRDPYMERVLNQVRTPDAITNIMEHHRIADLDQYHHSEPYEATISARGSYYFPIRQTPSLTREEYLNYATIYRDYIYNGKHYLYSNGGDTYGLCYDIPSGYSPLYACCFFAFTQYVSMDSSQELYQAYGLEYICQFSPIPMEREKIIFTNPTFTPHAII